MQIFQAFTHLPGPVFLAAYATVGVAFFMFCLLVRSQSDQDKSTSKLVPEVDPDPYRIAYLRGGANEVLRTATLELYCRGLLEEKEKFLTGKKWCLKHGIELPGSLSVFAAKTAKHYYLSRTPTEVFKSGLSKEFADEFKVWDEWIAKEEFRVTPEQQSTLNRLAIGLSILFFTIGLIKVSSAVLRDLDNVVFAIAMMFVGSIAIFLTRTPRRFNARGRQYLAQIQMVNSQHRTELRRMKAEDLAPDATNANNEANFVPLMAMGIFGVAALNGSPFDGFRKTYQRAEANGGGCGASCAGTIGMSGCGSSSHSSDGGSSCGAGGSGGGAGCGSGCGGCGGGGCGS